MNEDTKETTNLKKNYGLLGPACVIYACFYALCMYKNRSGITAPFFLAGSLWFYCFCMKKLGISLKKDSAFYMVSILLLGISTFLTADGRIITMNATGTIVLILSFLLHQFYDDRHWTFGRYAGNLVRTLFGCIGELGRPFSDLSAYQEKSEGSGGSGRMVYVVLGLCAGTPLFGLIWLLLASSDGVFMKMSKNFLNRINVQNIFGIGVTVIGMFFLSYCVMAYLAKHVFPEDYRERKQADALAAITVTVPLTVLYLIFCGVQIVCLFLGKMVGENLTYAEYARQGFFQLLTVCVINLILVLVGHAYFKENRVLKLILTIMSLCTYIMIISSAFRMLVYIKHYYLTFLRVFVLWSLAVIFILLTGVIISIYRRDFPLFRYAMVVVTVCYLGLSFSHPDYYIAKCNLANSGSRVGSFFDADAYQDYRYMTRLSADAAPAMRAYFQENNFTISVMEELQEQYSSSGEAYGGSMYKKESWGYYYLERIEEEYETMNLRSFNLSRYLAHALLQ